MFVVSPRRPLFGLPLLRGVYITSTPMRLRRAFKRDPDTVGFESDIRERVLDEIRPGVVAQWSDPREWILR